MNKANRYPQVTALARTLKELLRARGLYQNAIAKRLNVTERTVTRWLSGRGLTVQVLEDLCNLLGMTFVEFCEATQDDLEVRPKTLTQDQERALLIDGRLAFVFHLISRGWTPQEIEEICAISKPAFVRDLLQLERLRLIDLLPENKTRLLVARNVSWNDRYAEGRAFRDGMWEQFAAIDFTARESIWSCSTFNLSAQAAAELQAKISSFTLELQQAADATRSQHTSEQHWYVVFAAAVPLDPLAFGEG